MALVTCAGADVERGRLHLPSRGAWQARIKLDVATAPTGGVTLAAAGGLTASGTVATGGVQLDSAYVRIVGGAGGLGKSIAPAAYRAALVRDPLAAILSAVGETLSPTVDPALLATLLPVWTHTAERASAALDHLAYAAGQALGQAITWRVLLDGTVWIGAESWPAASLPSGDDVLCFFPDEGRYEIGASTPSLAPGVNLAGVGHVAAVDHWVASDQVRTWAWV
jgi:hypothetical protein